MKRKEALTGEKAKVQTFSEIVKQLSLKTKEGIRSVKEASERPFYYLDKINHNLEAIMYMVNKSAKFVSYHNRQTYKLKLQEAAKSQLRSVRRTSLPMQKSSRYFKDTR